MTSSTILSTFTLLNGTYKAPLRHFYADLKILIDVFLPCDKTKSSVRIGQTYMHVSGFNLQKTCG